MPTQPFPEKKAKPVTEMVAPYAIVAIAWVVYAARTLTQPVESNVYQLTDLQTLMLRLTIVVPYLVVWGAAIHGAVKFHAYAQMTRDSAQHQAFAAMQTGIYWLAASILGSTLLGTVRSSVGTSSAAYPALTIAVNYGYVILPLIAFVFLFIGTRRLLAGTGRVTGGTVGALMNIVLAVLSAAYIWLTFTNPGRQMDTSGISPYYLSDPLILSTIILPSIVSWFLGVRAVAYLLEYVRRSPAVIYEKSLPLLSYGITGIVGASIILQGLLSIGAVRLVNINLAGLLAIIYFFLLAQGGGYVLVAVAANRLAKLERIMTRYGANV